MIISSHLLYIYIIPYGDMFLRSLGFVLTKFSEVFIELQNHIELLLKLWLCKASICIKERSILIVILVLWKMNIYNVKFPIAQTNSGLLYLEKNRPSSLFKLWLTFLEAIVCFFNWIITFQWNLRIFFSYYFRKKTWEIIGGKLSA